MNEQIAKLASKSGFDVGIHEGLILGNFSDMYKIEKLAELIVRECAKIGSKAMYPDSDPDYVGRKIKQHFGVEE